VIAINIVVPDCDYSRHYPFPKGSCENVPTFMSNCQFEFLCWTPEFQPFPEPTGLLLGKSLPDHIMTSYDILVTF
jgi:hypothetical protein